MELADLLNLEKTVKQIGIYTPIVIFGYLFYQHKEWGYLVALIVSILFAVLYINIKDMLIELVGSDGGFALAQKMKFWLSKDIFPKAYVAIIAHLFLILAFIGILLETTSNVTPIPLILSVVSGATLLYKTLNILFSIDKIKAFVRLIKNK